MKQIILIRHTETLEFAQKQPILDSPLSDHGIDQAKQISTFLKSYTYEAIFTSLYKRAFQTAENLDIHSTKRFHTNAFNEYYTVEGKGVETTSDGATRAVTKLYSLFSLYESILITAHSSINQTILQCLLNIEYEKSKEYYHNFGETHVLRYDWTKGDTKWQIIDSFNPS